MKRSLMSLLIALCAFTLISIIPAHPALTQDDEEPTLEDFVLPEIAWDGQTRFTVLVLGMDRRPNARDTLSVRTDVMMLISFDPLQERIGVLHIPRDMHLTPPGTGDFIRVNTLMVQGENLQEGYGPYYAMDTLQYNLGLYIDRYIAFDFEAFIAIVDAIGGVQVTTEYIINDPTYPDMNYGFDPFFLSSGTHLLDGRTALKFARTRHGDNDFLRGVRQMQVITGIHERVSEAGTLPRLLLQAPTLFQEVSRNIYTDLTLDEMLVMTALTSRLNADDIHTGGINQQYSLLYTLPTGSAVYIPDRSSLADLMTEIFGENYYQ